MDATLACAAYSGAIAKQGILPGALTCTPTARPACAQTVAEQLLPQPPKLPVAIWLNLPCRRQSSRWTTSSSEKGAYVGQRTELVIAWV